MTVKFALATILLVLAFVASGVHSRSVHRNSGAFAAFVDHDSQLDLYAQPATAVETRDNHRGYSQARVFPGPITLTTLASKKLLLLKIKKLIPISMILLRSGNTNEAELLPVYPSSELPPNVHILPTPNGVTGHKDVQAIAIPPEIYEHLELNGLANLEGIQTLISGSPEDIPTDPEKAKVQVSASDSEDEDDDELYVNEADEEQFLEGASNEKPAAVVVSVKPATRRTSSSSADGAAQRLRQTAVEDLPLYLYSVKDMPKHTSSVERKISRKPVVRIQSRHNS